MFELNKTFVVTQEKGIHFRSMVKIKEICTTHDVDLVIRKESTQKQAEFANTMGVLLLCILQGDEVKFSIAGKSQNSVDLAAESLKLAFAT